MSDNTYVAPIQVDSDGDLILVFPDELLEALVWKEGDSLVWTNNEDGSWSLRKREDSDTK
jgi:bifunctional DNA-binding transcriptional regulator/antitoxin component of YhaV-PrlF toxin-antitoxin module